VEGCAVIQDLARRLGYRHPFSPRKTRDHAINACRECGGTKSIGVAGKDRHTFEVPGGQDGALPIPVRVAVSSCLSSWCVPYDRAPCSRSQDCAGKVPWFDADSNVRALGNANCCGNEEADSKSDNRADEAAERPVHQILHSLVGISIMRGMEQQLILELRDLERIGVPCANCGTHTVVDITKSDCRAQASDRVPLAAPRRRAPFRSPRRRPRTSCVRRIRYTSILLQHLYSRGFARSVSKTSLQRFHIMIIGRSPALMELLASGVG
jgi:hypothetical protein